MKRNHLGSALRHVVGMATALLVLAIAVILIGTVVNSLPRMGVGRRAEPSPRLRPRTPAPYPELKVTIENYPRVDGSLSTQPLQAALACRVLGMSTEWVHSEEDDSRTLWPDPYGDLGQPPMPKDRVEQAFLLGEFIAGRIRPRGTHEAYLNVAEGRADLALVARLPTDDELSTGDKFDARPVALDAFVFLLSTKNPVESLTIAQIRDIYSGRIKNWRDVGGPDAPIRAYQRPRNSGSQELMQTLVMDGRPMIGGPDLLLEALMSSPFLALRDDVHGIGYSVYYYQEFMAPYADAVKACAVGGIAPNAETIRSGRYPLVTPVYLVVRRDLPPDHAAVRLRDWLLGPEGQKVVEESGYVPAAGP